MRVNFLVAAFVVCANAVPVAEPEAATPVGYAPQTVTVTVNAQPTVRTVTSTQKTSTRKSTVTVAPVATSRKTTSTKKSTTSTKKTSTSTKKTSTSTKKSTTSTKRSTTSTKSATVGTPLTTKKTTSTTSKRTTSSTKATTSTQVAAAKPTTLEQIAVYHHNLHRSNHSAVNIKWSSSLASIAAQIAATCVYEHNTAAGGGGYGQNIAAGIKADNISQVITGLFYNGEMPYYNGLYGQSQPSYANFAHWGHFSQVVWKDTTTVGCAVQHCTNGLKNAGSGIPPYFTVCNYEPAGNFGGEYADNIGRPLGHPVARWNTGL